MGSTEDHPIRWGSLPTLATYGNRFHGACLTAHGLGGDNLAVSRVAGRILAKHNACALNMWSGGAGGWGRGIAGSQRRFLRRENHNELVYIPQENDKNNWGQHWTVSGADKPDR